MTSGRRKFIKQVVQLSGYASTLAIPTQSILANSAGYYPNDTIHLGLIGCRNMGWANLMSILKNVDVKCIALCDVDNNILQERAAELQKLTNHQPRLYKDYRSLLDNKDIDAVIIATPDHWHCLQMVHACQAGKDVYVEKPIANSIEECNVMLKAKQTYNSVVQVGLWQQSDPHWRTALQVLKSGQLGTIRSVRTWANVNYGSDFGIVPDSAVPTGVDYDMWLGPAPSRPFNKNRFHGSFRYFWDYGGGLLTDWGAHMLDMVLCGLDLSVPQSVVATGGNFGYPNSPMETPDTLNAIFEYQNLSVSWEHLLGTGVAPYGQGMGRPGVAFVGNNGTLIINRRRWEVIPQTDRDTLELTILEGTSTESGLDHHTRNFVDCIRSRKSPNGNLEKGYLAALTAHLGNLSYRLGDKLYWDKDTGDFQNNTKATALSKARYREPYELPSI